MWLSQAGPPIVSDWASLGGLGILAGFLLLAVRVLFANSTKSLDVEREALKLERARSDRLEGELRKLNETIQDRILVTLAAALETIQREDRGR